VSQVPESPWPLVGALLSATVLGVAIWVNFIRPAMRRRELASPCDCYFHIRTIDDGKPLGYVQQDDKGHNVKELVLPSHTEVEIEVNSYALVNYVANDVIFGCDGDKAAKPLPLHRVVPFVQVGKSEYRPGVDDGDYINRKGWYHFKPLTTNRPKGVCSTMGFRLKTQQPGRYQATMVFMGDGVEGYAKDLYILVEDDPKTTVQCFADGHWQWKCRLTPRKLEQSDFNRAQSTCAL